MKEPPPPPPERGEPHPSGGEQPSRFTFGTGVMVGLLGGALSGALIIFAVTLERFDVALALALAVPFVALLMLSSKTFRGVGTGLLILIAGGAIVGFGICVTSLNNNSL